MLGDLVAKLRNERGWTQVDLADAAGISQSAISGIESGTKRNLRASTVEALARAFGIPVAELWPEVVETVEMEERPPARRKGLELITDEDALDWLARQNQTLAELMRAVQALPADQRAKVLDHIERQLDLLLSLTESGANDHDDNGPG